MTQTVSPPTAQPGHPQNSSPQWHRLRPMLCSDRFWGWFAPGLVTLVGGLQRFWHLDRPHKLVFDEVYYVKEGVSYLHYGYEQSFQPIATGSHDPFTMGNQSAFATTSDFVVHPPVGKWMIAAGEWLFGAASSWGWRFSAALVGTLAILMIGRIGRRLFHSTVLGTTAAVLLAVDGQEFVHSRTGILDIFVMFWALAAFGCLLIDRDHTRTRCRQRNHDCLARTPLPAPARPAATWRHAFGPAAPNDVQTRRRRLWWAITVATGASGSTLLLQGATSTVFLIGAALTATPVLMTVLWAVAARIGGAPLLGPRPWRIAAIICLALCTGVKWSGLYFTAAFLITSVCWDIAARRAAGVRDWFLDAISLDGLQAALSTIILLPTIYIATWAGWFHGSNGWDRQWGARHPAESGWGWVPDSVRGLIQYHTEMWNFHITLHTPHPYQSNPWSWMVLGRPTAFFYQKTMGGQGGCHVEECSRAIIALGNPLIWWTATLGIGVLLFRWFLARDWRASAVLTGLIGGYLPWFMFQGRTIFEFYAVAFVPWVVLTVTYCLGLLIGSQHASATRHRRGMLAAGCYVFAAVMMFWFFVPVLDGQLISHGSWSLRMWLPSWI